MKTQKTKIWNNLKFDLGNHAIFSRELLRKYVNTFWGQIMETLNDESHIILLLRLVYMNDDVATICNLQKLNKNDKSYFIDHIMDSLNYQVNVTSASPEKPIKAIIFSYGIRKGKIEDQIKPTIIKENINIQIFYNNKLPITFDPLDFGELMKQKDNQYVVKRKNNLIIINQMLSNDENKYNLVEFYRFTKNRLIFTWKDTFITDNSFVREIGKRLYYFERVNQEKPYELTLTEIVNKVKFIETLKKGKPQVDNKFLIMDLETFAQQVSDKIKKLNPYLLCWYDGSSEAVHFTDNYKSFEDLVFNVINELTTYKYKNYKIYFHNFSRFDSIFLLKLLVNINNCIVDPIIHDGKIIQIIINFNNITLTFRDTCLILPSSQKELCESFKTTVKKSAFPIFMNDINYSGEVPDYKFFNQKQVSKEEYLEYKSKFTNKIWNFRDEAKIYCMNDCKSLYEILVKFNSLIYNKFNINIHNYPTLPSLSFAIFRSNYLTSNTVASLTDKVYRDIKLSYTGGAVDMYIPSNDYCKELIYSYDVNSLYPFIMLTKPMPIGKPSYFVGDIRKINKEAFGFFYCKVITPENLSHPIIQIHHKTKSGIRTISPLGSFEMMIFSEEMDNAIKYGYKFEILWGYTFSKGLIFKDIINDLYNIRLKYPKTEPMNYIAKILMNSLYGRFGMSESFDEIIIINSKDYKNFEKKFISRITDIIKLGNNYLIKLKTDTSLENNLSQPNINIAVASCITSYSRIHMSQFKNNLNYKLFYSDTDSIYINKPLDKALTSSKEIGKLKLENISSKGIFIAPKVYGLVTSESKKIIKVKGLVEDSIKKLTISLLEGLLMKDSLLPLDNIKFNKILDEATITILDQAYKLRVTGNKRKLIYKNNKLINTKPLTIGT